MPEQWLVISDIDDTLYYTTNKYLSIYFSYIYSLFVHPQSINGMPDLFTLLERELSSLAFIYLSASPYRLFVPFKIFHLDEYPDGEIILPSIKRIFQIYIQDSLFSYKFKHLESLHSNYSSSKLLLFGDSLMQDPNIYSKLYLKYPNWIFAILIRKPKETQNKLLGLERVFKDIPPYIYLIYEEYNELWLYLKGRLDLASIDETK
jgi:phosphatidate phosphatase APP1